MKSFFFKFLSVLFSIIGATFIFQNVNAHQEDIAVSVIVPVYNVEKYIGECADSIIGQSLKNIEIIFVNDGSTDSSLQILREYEKKDDRVVVIDKANQGVSSARNSGIDAARGKYMAFVDSDDWIDKYMYEILYDAAETHDADIVCCGWKNFPKNGCSRKDCLPKKFEVYEDWFTAKRRRESINIWNKLYKGSLIAENELHFNTNISYAEDECFNLCVYPLTKRVVSVPAKLYNYRVRESSATFSSTKKKFANYINVWKYVLKVWKSYGVSKSTYCRLFTYPLTYRGELLSFIESCL